MKSRKAIVVVAIGLTAICLAVLPAHQARAAISCQGVTELWDGSTSVPYNQYDPNGNFYGAYATILDHVPALCTTNASWSDSSAWVMLAGDFDRYAQIGFGRTYKRTVPVGVNIDDPGPGPREIGMRYDPIDAVTAAESVSQDKAIAAALSWIALPADLQASAHIETRLVLCTDENQYRQDPSGNKQYLVWRIPAWVVTISGIDIPLHGGVPGRKHQIRFNHEMNVVIDARTGQYIQAFSYR